MEPNEYQCAQCLEVYVKTRTDGEAMDEAEENGFVGMALAIVCDDCYHEVMGNISQNPPKE